MGWKVVRGPTMRNGPAISSFVSGTSQGPRTAAVPAPRAVPVQSVSVLTHCANASFSNS